MKGRYIIAAVVGLGILAWGISTNNRMVKERESVRATYAQVQNVLKRQYELITNLANTVEKYAEFERGTFTDVAAARAKAGGIINIPIADMMNDPEKAKQFAEKQNELQNSIGGLASRLLSVQEKYPNLKADKQFTNFTTELSGSANRVSVERKRNNATIEVFNVDIQTFPASLIASIKGYKELPYFEAPAEQQSAPVVFQKK